MRAKFSLSRRQEETLLVYSGICTPAVRTLLPDSLGGQDPGTGPWVWLGGGQNLQYCRKVVRLFEVLPPFYANFSGCTVFGKKMGQIIFL